MKTILFFGSKHLSEPVDVKRRLIERLAGKVVQLPGWRILTGGNRGRGNDLDEGGVDFHAALGARRALADPALEQQRILTLHPGEDQGNLFEIGLVFKSRAKSFRARRFEMVARSDCGIMIEGHGISADVLEDFIAAGKPVIPVRSTGGEAEKAWNRDWYRGELLEGLKLSEDSPELLAIGGNLDNSPAVTEGCIRLLQRLLRPTCFVAMPFESPHSTSVWQDLLKPVIEETGLAPIRADEIPSTSQIIEDTHDV